MTDWTLLPVVAILFLATLVRATLGFGDALIAVPLLALLMPVEQAAPIAVLASITIALIILARDWRDVHFRSAGWLIFSTLCGIPAGLMLLKTAPTAVVKSLLGAIIVVFSLYSMRRGRRFKLDDDRLAWLFGLQAGVMGGAYGMNGPPLVMYGSLRQWKPGDFRATLQAYFLPASLAGMGGYWLTGLWTPVVSHFYITALPAVILATLLGRMVGSRLRPERFTYYVYAGLTAAGVALLLQALGGG